MEKDLLKRILIKSKNDNVFISVYTNTGDVDKFSLGIVCNFDKEFVLLKKVNPEGNFDGFSIILLEDIYLIEYNDKYIKKISALIKDDIAKKKEDVQNLLIANFRFDDAIKLCVRENFLVSINSIYDKSFIGYIKDYDGKNVTINNIDEYNVEDGMSLFKILEIEKISIFQTELNAINNIQ